MPLNAWCRSPPCSLKASNVSSRNKKCMYFMKNSCCGERMPSHTKITRRDVEALQHKVIYSMVDRVFMLGRLVF